MLKMDTVVVVKHKVLVEGRSRRETAKELKISRNTVRRYLDGAQPGVRAAPVRERPVADLVEQRLLAILEESQQWTSGKQQLTARRLHEMVLKEDMACGYTLVKNFLARWKNKRREVFVPLVWAAGDAAEVDFFEVLVDLDGTRRKAWMFVMRLMHSGRDFAWLYQWQDQACFLDGHVRAFAHFAGAPARVLYDNLKAAVARILVGSERELTRRFAAMASHSLWSHALRVPPRVMTRAAWNREASTSAGNCWFPFLPGERCWKSTKRCSRVWTGKWTASGTRPAKVCANVLSEKASMAFHRAHLNRPPR
jgi:transposase